MSRRLRSSHRSFGATKIASLCAFVGLSAAAAVASCSLDTGGSDVVGEPFDASRGHPSDASLDAVVGDENADAAGDVAANDGVAADAGEDVVDGADTGTGADVGPNVDAGPVLFACPGADASASDCSACPDAGLPCVFCGNGGHTGLCVPVTDRCNMHIPGGYAVCPCPSGDAAVCPMPYQVCHDGPDGMTCRTCGEPGTTSNGGDACKSGGKCSALLTCK